MSGRFKVMQLNMQFGQIWDERDPDHAPVRIESVIEEIRTQDADVVMLQEVEHAQPGGTQPPMPPNYLALKHALPGYESFFAYPKEDPRELPFGIGLAIFSKAPLRDTVRYDLPSPPVEFDFYGEKKTPTDRLLIGATASIGGRSVRLFNTHLLAFFMLNSSSEQHIEQRRLVVEQLKQSPGPTLLAGDFNVSKHDSLIRQFHEAGYETVQSTEVTWRRRPLVLDHIFHNQQLRPQRYWVRPTPASDHHVLLAEFGFAV